MTPFQDARDRSPGAIQVLDFRRMDFPGILNRSVNETLPRNRDQVPFGYEYLGEQTVKNISKPVGAYRVVLEPRVTKRKAGGGPLQRERRTPLVYGSVAVLALLLSGVVVWQFILRPGLAPVEIAPPHKIGSLLPDKPSIAVLPFTNMSVDPQQEYFSDGISEDIITDLSKISGLIVIARNSCFTYKGKTVNVQQIGQDLGVRYLLEGSVRKAGDQMRINAQLMDASNGQHLWAERYDGKFDDV